MCGCMCVVCVHACVRACMHVCVCTCVPGFIVRSPADVNIKLIEMNIMELVNNI